MAKTAPRLARIKRHARVRQKVYGTPERPRLCVFHSLNHIYAQVVDDTRGHTVAAASTLDPEARGETDGKTKSGHAQLVGGLIARRALSQGIKAVTFDRAGFKYHGRVKALAEAARSGGLDF